MSAKTVYGYVFSFLTDDEEGDTELSVKVKEFRKFFEDNKIDDIFIVRPDFEANNAAVNGNEANLVVGVVTNELNMHYNGVMNVTLPTKDQIAKLEAFKKKYDLGEPEMFAFCDREH